MKLSLQQLIKDYESTKGFAMRLLLFNEDYEQARKAGMIDDKTHEAFQRYKVSELKCTIKRLMDMFGSEDFTEDDLDELFA